MHSSPKISIGMPIYNGGLSLEQTLPLILNQEFQDFELIISDDCSTDNTQELCEKYASLDPRIKYYRQEKNFGMPVKNFKFVLSKAQGEFFMFASHDDPYKPEFITEMLKIMDFDPDCSLAFCCYNIKNKNGPEKIAISPSSSCSKFTVVRYISRLIDLQPALVYGLFRKKFITAEDLNLHDFYEVDIGIKMALRGTIRIANSELWNWNIAGSRISHSIYPIDFYVRDLLGLRRKKISKKTDIDPSRRFSETQMENRKMNYLPFYFNQIKLLFSNFSILNALLLSIILSYFVFRLIYKILFKPNWNDLHFGK
jgi:glycosyltransferase involved in cell wall biosynthesis